MAITAANIPPELFEGVLNALTLASYHYGQTNSVPAEKRELHNCAMVCKYWSRMCQPKLFQSVTLRSHQDVYQLLEFLNAPLSKIAGYIHSFNIPPQKLPCEPWVHLLSLLHKKVPVRYIALAFEGPLPETRSIRSIHDRLPRAPPTFSYRIQTLVLRDIHFRSLGHLVHVVLELRDLENLDCTKVTWSGETSLVSLLSRKTNVSLEDVSMTECTLNLCAVWFVLGIRRREELGIAPEDWACLLESIHFVESFVDETRTEYSVYAGIAEHESGVSCHVTFRGRSGESIHSFPCISFTLSGSSAIPSLLPYRREISFIENISIDFSMHDDVFENVLDSKCDWGTFDDHLSHFLSLKRVVLGFSSRDEMTTYNEKVLLTSMPSLLGCGKLVYAIRRDKSSKSDWLYASLECNDTKDSGSDELFEL